VNINHNVIAIGTPKAVILADLASYHTVILVRNKVTNHSIDWSSDRSISQPTNQPISQLHNTQHEKENKTNKQLFDNKSRDYIEHNEEIPFEKE